MSYSGSGSSRASPAANTLDTLRSDALCDCNMQCASECVNLLPLAQADSPVPLPRFLKKDSFDELSGLLANLPINTIALFCPLCQKVIASTKSLTLAR
jgi:hypothetical protein